MYLNNTTIAELLQQVEPKVPEIFITEQVGLPVIQQLIIPLIVFFAALLSFVTVCVKRMKEGKCINITETSCQKYRHKDRIEMRDLATNV